MKRFFNQLKTAIYYLRRMEKITILFLTFLFCTPIFNAQVKGSIESQTLFSEGKIASTQINLFLKEKIEEIDGLSWTAWGLISKNWSESYVGLSYSPIDEFEMSLSYGLETNNSPQRIGCSFWLGKEGFSLLSIFEQGGSGYWFKHILKYNFSTFGVGIYYQRFKGYGPYLETEIFFKFKLWSSYMVDEEGKRSYVGIRLLF